jgi:hypothetical protein
MAVTAASPSRTTTRTGPALFLALGHMRPCGAGSVRDEDHAAPGTALKAVQEACGKKVRAIFWKIYASGEGARTLTAKITSD